MSQFTLYGMDADHRLLLTEFLDAPDLKCAEWIVRQRLDNFPVVELWEASSRLSRWAMPDAQPAAGPG